MTTNVDHNSTAHLTRKLAVLALLCVLAQPLASHADWTVPLPARPYSGEPRPHSVNRFGVLVFSSGDSRISWYSSEGTLLMDYSWDRAEFAWDGENWAVLNGRQLVLGGPGPNKRIRLLSLSPAGTYTVRDYLLTSSQRPTYWYDTNEADLSAFYYTDTVSWTITRVDFPKPEGGLKTIEFQSAEQPTGPWTTIEQTTVPSDQPQEFFRLAITE